MKLNKLPTVIMIELILGILAIVLSGRNQSFLEVYLLISFVLIPALIVYRLFRKPDVNLSKSPGTNNLNL